MTLCPKCGGQSNVIDSRPSQKTKGQLFNEAITRRRRQCKKCKEKYTTYELSRKEVILVKNYQEHIEGNLKDLERIFNKDFLDTMIMPSLKIKNS